jgi:hypothetical protein
MSSDSDSDFEANHVPSFSASTSKRTLRSRNLGGKVAARERGGGLVRCVRSTLHWLLSRKSAPLCVGWDGTPAVESGSSVRGSRERDSECTMHRAQSSSEEEGGKGGGVQDC